MPSNRRDAPPYTQLTDWESAEKHISHMARKQNLDCSSQ